MNANEQPEREAYCLTRPAGWEYHPASTHDDGSLFRERQIARFRRAELERQELAQRQEREAA